MLIVAELSADTGHMVITITRIECAGAADIIVVVVGVMDIVFAGKILLET
jgi:hypothetical protein